MLVVFFLQEKESVLLILIPDYPGDKNSVFWRYSTKYMTMEVVAMRDLKAGEEIVHTCKSPSHPIPSLPPSLGVKQKVLETVRTHKTTVADRRPS